MSSPQRGAVVTVFPGALSEQSVQFNVQVGGTVTLWEMERGEAVRHAAKVLHLAGITEMHIGPDGKVTCT